MNYTRESLELAQKEHGHANLRDIGALLGVKSTSSEALITKILQAQNDKPAPNPSDSPVDFVGFDGLTAQKRNTEVPYGDDGWLFPALVDEARLEDLQNALLSFSHQWNFEKVEFFLKFQAFRLYKDGRHVDWINLKELINRYNLKLGLNAGLISRRMYTAPDKRAYS